MADFETVAQSLKEISHLLNELTEGVASLANLKVDVKEQRQHIDEIRKTIDLIEERQSGLNLQIAQALNTLISQSKTPAVLQIGLFCIIVLMFVIHVLGWKVGGNYGGVRFESVGAEQLGEDSQNRRRLEKQAVPLHSREIDDRSRP